MAYTGVYERTIFYNPVNKYSVISVKTSDRSIPEKARSAYRHRDNMIHFAAVGYELPRTDQVSMILDGEWKEGKNGVQLHVTQCEEVVPQTREGIKGYLSSRLIKGIGGRTAELIVDRFGADTLNVLENEPERLLEIRGVSETRLKEIIASYNESRALRDLMLLLAPFQITPTAATKIYDHFGARSVDILRDNPFELCQISGFGFKRVDAIMRKNNWPLNSPMRIRGAVFAALESAKGDGGHLYLEAEQLHKEAMLLLNSMIPVPQMRVKSDDLDAVIDDMLLQGKIINSNGNYYLVKTFAQEDETARSIARLLCRPVERVDVQDLLTRVRRQLGVELSLRQTEAVHMVFRSDLSIITGSPGTGKTTVLKAVIEVFKLLKPSEKILLAAPTGRASRRMAESTGVNNASTLHSLLGLFGEDDGFRKGEEDRSIIEFLVAYELVEAFTEKKPDFYKLKSILSQNLKDDITNFVNAKLQSLSGNEKELIKERLKRLYSETLENEVSIQEKIIYHITRLGVDASDFLREIVNTNPQNYILRLTLAYGCALCQDGDLRRYALNYAESLANNSQDAITNRAWTVVYFGDVDADPYTYKDNKDDNWVQKGTGWERARAARLKRFSARGNRDKDYRFRLFDIPLFRTFLETRNWADISENEYTIISNVEFPPEYFGSEEREFLSREKEKLLRGYRAALDERENNQLQKSPKDKAK